MALSPNELNLWTVSVLLNGELMDYWESVEITDSIDSFSSVTFSAPMEPDNETFRNTFKPFAFQDVKVYVQRQQLFEGTMLSVEPEVTADYRRVNCSAYSKPAVLNDVTLAYADLPIEFGKLAPRNIIEMLAQKFGIAVDVQADLGGPIKRAKYKVDDNVLEFITRLTQQRNAVIANSAKGQLIVWQSVKPGSPVATLIEENIPKLTPEFKSQEYYSEVTAVGVQKKRQTGDAHTEENPFLPTSQSKRPLMFKLKNGEPGDVQLAAKAKLGRMFGNIATYRVQDIPSWFDPNGKLWQVNTTVSVTAPNAMIYKPYELLIRSLTRKASKGSYTTDLELVLPGAFSGEVPATLPWM